MKTDDLIGMLSQGAGPAGPAGDGRRMAFAVALSFPVVVAVAFVLGLLPLSDWATSSTGPKMVYAAAMACAGVVLLRRAGRPGAPVAGPLAAIAGMLVLVAAIGVYDILRLPPEARAMQMMGKSWSVCPLLILVLSLPLQIGMPWAARSLAPVRPGLAGAAAGLVAGGMGMAAYALHCDEPAAGFIAIWYSLGIALSVLLGWAIGSRALRW